MEKSSERTHFGSHGNLLMNYSISVATIVTTLAIIPYGNRMCKNVKYIEEIW